MVISSMKKIEELSGFRKPTNEEKEIISQYFQAIFTRDMKVCKYVSIFLSSIGITALLSMIFSGPIVGIVCLIFAIYAITVKKRYQNNIDVFKNGKFQVLEGTVQEMSVNVDYPGAFNVRFQSNNGEILRQWCTVQQRDLQLDTPLLLAYAGNDLIKGGISRAFTPQMLSSDALKHFL